MCSPSCRPVIGQEGLKEGISTLVYLAEGRIKSKQPEIRLGADGTGRDGTGGGWGSCEEGSEEEEKTIFFCSLRSKP